MENINVKTSGLSLAILSTLLSLLCALSYWLFPSLTISYFNYIVHGIDITQIITTSISLGSIVIGLIEIIIYAYITGALFAWVYNKIK